MSDDNSHIKKGVGDKNLAMRSNWSFDGDTPNHFVSHMRRSVPL